MARREPLGLRGDPLVTMLANTTTVLVLFTLAYFMLPLGYERANPLTFGKLVLSLAALAGLAWLFRHHVRNSQAQPARYLRIQWLLTALYGLVLLFAMGYAMLESHDSDQFAGLDSRIDALYFSVTTVATVGFGDVHATGGTARLIVTGHMIFNLIYLGTALRVLTGPGPGPRGGPFELGGPDDGPAEGRADDGA